jgi:hypothetical protein
MEKRDFVIVFLMSLLLLPAALSVNAAESENYFPLNLHNEWTYLQTGRTVNQTVVVDVNEMIQPVNQDIAFFKLNNFNGSYHWVQQSPSGMVTEKPHYLWYDFNREVGESWTMNINTMVSKVIPGTNNAILTIISRNEPVQVPAGNFRAIHIGYRTGVADAGITNEWFAPDVGLIKRTESSFGGEISMVLTRAVINGKIIEANGVEAIIITD